MRAIPSQARLGTFVGFGVVGIALLAAVSMAVWPRRELTPQDERYLAEYLRTCSLTEAIWPGWAPGDCDIVLCKPRRQYLVTRRAPPDGVALVVGKSVADRRVYVVRTPSSTWPIFGTDRVGDRLGTRPVLYVPDYETWTSSRATIWQVEPRIALREALEENRFLAAYFGRPLYDPPFTGEEGYVSSYFHLSFHLFIALGPEGRSQALCGLSPRDPPGYVGHGLDSVGARDFDRERQLEHRHLFQAIAAKDAWEREVEARLFLRGRAMRHNRVAADRRARFIANERYAEWREGLAAYTEFRLHQLAAAGLSASAGDTPLRWSVDVTEAQFFERMEVALRFDELRGTRTRILATGASEGDSVAFSRDAYIMGLAQALLLDKVLPGWGTESMEKGMPQEMLLARAFP